MLNYVKCPTLNWHFPPFLMKAKIDEKYHLSTLRVKISHKRSFWFNTSGQSQSSIIQGPGRGSHSDDPINGGERCNNRASKAPNRLGVCNINFLSAFKGLQMLGLAWAWNTFRGALNRITVIGYLTYCHFYWWLSCLSGVVCLPSLAFFFFPPWYTNLKWNISPFI